MIYSPGDDDDDDDERDRERQADRQKRMDGRRDKLPHRQTVREADKIYSLKF